MSEISVIIPVYNTEKYLKECLKSVINQTFTDMEIICVNDGSTDSSKEVLEKYKKVDKRIKVIELQENRGLSYARNRGFDSSKGRYIYFLDSDDELERNAMEILYNEAEKEKLDVIFFDAKIKYENEKFRKKFETYISIHIGKYDGVKTGIELFKEFVKNQEWTTSVPRQFWKRDFLISNQLKFFEGIIHEDELFAFKAIVLADRAKCINECLFIRRFRDDSIMTNDVTDRNFYGYFTAFYLINKYVYEYCLESDIIKKYLAILYGKVVRFYETTKDKYDLSLGFKDKELINAYYFFVSTQNQYMAYGSFDETSMQKVRKYDKIYIYGAGIIGKSVYTGLARNNIMIKGFIVSENKDNVDVVMGHPVVELEKIQFSNENILVVVAVNVKFQKQIISKLVKTKLSYILYSEMEKLNF